jgi:hypothetical protein
MELHQPYHLIWLAALHPALSFEMPVAEKLVTLSARLSHKFTDSPSLRVLAVHHQRHLEDIQHLVQTIIQKKKLSLESLTKESIQIVNDWEPEPRYKILVRYTQFAIQVHMCSLTGFVKKEATQAAEQHLYNDIQSLLSYEVNFATICGILVSSGEVDISDERLMELEAFLNKNTLRYKAFLEDVFHLQAQG